LERTKIWSWVPTGPKTKNDCTGEHQQKIAALKSSYTEKSGLSHNFLSTALCQPHNDREEYALVIREISQNVKDFLFLMSYFALF
jgi:hypothetical protein